MRERGRNGHGCEHGCGHRWDGRNGRGHRSSHGDGRNGDGRAWRRSDRGLRGVRGRLRRYGERSVQLRRVRACLRRCKAALRSWGVREAAVSRDGSHLPERSPVLRRRVLPGVEDLLQRAWRRCAHVRRGRRGGVPDELLRVRVAPGIRPQGRFSAAAIMSNCCCTDTPSAPSGTCSAASRRLSSREA